MIIRSLSISAHFKTRLGLDQSELKGLDHVVVLAGENGCGKTRLLSAVGWWLEQINRIGYDNLQQSHQMQIELTRILNPPSSNPYGMNVFLGEEYDGLGRISNAPFSGLELAFNKNENQDDSLRHCVEFARFFNSPFDRIKQKYSESLTIGLPRKNQKEPYIDPLLLSPVSYICDIYLRYKRELAERGFVCPHDSRIIDPNNSGIIAEFRKLNNLLNQICGLDLNRDTQGIPLLNGIPLNETNLSHGQMILFRWVVIIHSKVLSLTSFPILIDEPELHLHPKALNLLFDELMDSAPNSQLWVGTHSLSLISHLTAKHPRCLWFGQENKFSNAGKVPQVVVEGLIGGDGGSEELVDFCSYIDRFALISFAADCLFPPGAEPYKQNDPQLGQIAKNLKTHNTGEVLLVLDYGAGRGRLLEELALKFPDINSKISYYAIEHNDIRIEECKRQVNLYYGNEHERVFPSLDAALISQSGLSIDVVILANLLHEIPPIEWLIDVFNKDKVNGLLIEDGWYLIVEDTMLPRGELANHCGFVVLEQAALEVLFAVTEADKQGQMFKLCPSDKKYGERLQATKVSKKLLLRVTKDSIVDALTLQKKLALDRIRTLRSSQKHPTYVDGRMHAYLSQLVTNTTLAIEDMINA